MASAAGSKVSDMAGTVKERAVGLGQRTGQQVRRAREGYWDLVERRPMAAGVATMAAGLLVGLLIPNTRRENRLMGETRDELLRGARDASQRTLEKTKEVARTAMDAAGTAAQSEAQRQKLPLVELSRLEAFIRESARPVEPAGRVSCPPATLPRRPVGSSHACGTAPSGRRLDKLPR